ncbi:MAG: hypothetical protein EOP83_04000 [Verrucomicrobiaceae bacterium]|nr:MAG: hypothetical protein EOP83_04000 [Verrucomicrobiaceae bacterium]
MKTPSLFTLLGFALLVTAGIFLALPRHSPVSSQDNSPAVAHGNPGHHPRGPFPTNPSGADTPSSDEPLILTPEGLADFANYDRNNDGDPEVDAFIKVYRRVDTDTARIDLLENVRTFDSLDEPLLNDLLIDQAAKAPDPEVRKAARSALFEHGGAKAHESLAVYLKSETRAVDRQALEKLLADLQRSPLGLARSGSKPSLSPSLPSTNN